MSQANKSNSVKPSTNSKAAVDHNGTSAGIEFLKVSIKRLRDEGIAVNIDASTGGLTLTIPALGLTEAVNGLRQIVRVDASTEPA